jgi:hypothetical protein
MVVITAVALVVVMASASRRDYGVAAIATTLGLSHAIALYVWTWRTVIAPHVDEGDEPSRRNTLTPRGRSRKRRGRKKTQPASASATRDAFGATSLAHSGKQSSPERAS